MYQIYKITNQKNGMVYIGSSIDVERRWRNHKEAAFNHKDHHYNYPLMQAFRQFGIDNFSFKIVETVTDWNAMIEAEHNWIIKENCVKPNGYNQTDKTNSPMFDPTVAKKMSNTKREKYGKQICEIDKNGNIINKWSSIAEASESTLLDKGKISAVCNGTRITTGSRIFRFLDENGNIIEPIMRINKTQSNKVTKASRRVIKMDNSNNEIQIYDSIALAAIDNNCDASGISKVCKKKRNKCGGFKWKYQII